VLAVTTTEPLVAAGGTGTTIVPSLQFVGVAGIPLNVTLLVPCVAPKYDPLIVIDVPTYPEVGEMLFMTGARNSGTVTCES
jgi:hypothetical protein